MPLHELSWINIFENLLYVTAEPTKLPPTEVRSNGVAKCCFGALKFSIIPLVVDPLLSYRSSPPIYHPCFHPVNLCCTFLYGTKMFCALSILDIALGLAQACLGINMIRMFESPFLATSPKDFWR
ncbi:hypothetical protein BY458DRAFT_436551 [Sporodiniella umbellata]|nr:hypothetical protein BY458DRAFT_436551 [Sporodiniella umbellata]